MQSEGAEKERRKVKRRGGEKVEENHLPHWLQHITMLTFTWISIL
jgi:hypothetical protein